MIKLFRHRGLKALYKQGESRHVNPAHQEKLGDILAALDHSSRPEDMNLPGFHLHPLKGDLKGHLCHLGLRQLAGDVPVRG